MWNNSLQKYTQHNLIYDIIYDLELYAYIQMRNISWYMYVIFFVIDRIEVG